MTINIEDFDDRIKKLRSVMEEYPNSDGFISLANLYLDIGEKEKSIEFLTDCIRKHPDLNEINLELARRHRKSGDLEKSMNYLKTFLATDRDNLEGLLEYGELLEKLDIPDEEVLKHYESVQEIYPDNLEISKKIQSLRGELIEKQPDEEEEVPSLSLIKLYWKQGFLTKAISLCDKFIEKNPENQTARELHKAITEQLTEQETPSGEISFEVPQPIKTTERLADEFKFSEFDLSEKKESAGLSPRELELDIYELPELISFKDLDFDEVGAISQLEVDEKRVFGDYEIVFSKSLPFSELSKESEFTEFNIVETEDDRIDEEELDKIIDLTESDESFQDWLDKLIEE